MILRRLIFLVAPTAVACGASTAPTEVVSRCDNAIFFAVGVNVRDARTERPVGGSGTLYGTYYSSIGVVVDTARVVNPDSLTFVTGARGGTYDLRLQVPGFKEWTKNGVVVPSDPSGCAPVLTKVEASIERTG